jgi:hypothetical protein
MSDNEPLTQEDYTSDDDVGSLVLDAPDPVPPTNVNYFLIAEDLVRYTEEHLGVLDILVIAREIASYGDDTAAVIHALSRVLVHADDDYVDLISYAVENIPGFHHVKLQAIVRALRRMPSVKN